MTTNDKILIEILNNLSFQNKLIAENDNVMLDLNMRILNIEKKITLLEKKITETQRKTNDIYYVLFKISENIGVNNIILLIFCILQIIILFKIF
jgi:hypothetical protein